MKDLQEATARICELKGSLVAMDALLTALLQHLPDAAQADLSYRFERTAEVARTVMLNAPISETTMSTFERDVGRTRALLASRASSPAP